MTMSGNSVRGKNDLDLLLQNRGRLHNAVDSSSDLPRTVQEILSGPLELRKHQLAMKA